VNESYNTSTFFGLSRVLEEELRTELEQFLLAAWRAQYDEEPGQLTKDLGRLEPLFRPRVSGAVLRDAAAALRELAVPRPDSLPASLFLEIDARHGFVTAEGRLVLDLCLSREPGRLLIEDSDLLSASLLLCGFYGEPARAAVHRAVAQPDLRPLSFAFALLLLLNGSVGEERALRSPTTSEEERRLMVALGPALNAFSEAIGGKPLTEKEAHRMEGNWVLTEVARQLPTLFAKTKAGYWLRPGAVDSAPARLGELLARRKNAPSEEALSVGLQALEYAYRHARPALSALGMAHDRPTRTRAIVSEVLSGFCTQVGARLEA